MTAHFTRTGSHIACVGTHHRHSFVAGRCSGCSSPVAWVKGRMVNVEHASGRVACWAQTHTCPVVEESGAVLAARSTVETLTGIRAQVTDPAALASLDAQLATAREIIAAG